MSNDNIKTDSNADGEVGLRLLPIQFSTTIEESTYVFSITPLLYEFIFSVLKEAGATIGFDEKMEEEFAKFDFEFGPTNGEPLPSSEHPAVVVGLAILAEDGPVTAQPEAFINVTRAMVSSWWELAKGPAITLQEKLADALGQVITSQDSSSHIAMTPEFELAYHRKTAADLLISAFESIADPAADSSKFNEIAERWRRNPDADVGIVPAGMIGSSMFLRAA